MKNHVSSVTCHKMSVQKHYTLKLVMHAGGSFLD